MMVSKTKTALAGLALAGFIFLSLGINGVAQAAGGLTAAMETQIQAQIQALIIDSGDTAISEQALTDMVAANPSAAKDIADFATRPANLPSDLSADAVENLVIAVARAAASGAPEMAGDVVNALVD
ncbi:MAG: hypothetical protein VCD50_00895 [Alphaproteobacteria bacterium]